MATGIISCGFMAPKPKGDLTYCSYAQRGAAGLGSDYCELIADAEGGPKVVVVMDEGNRFGDPEIRREYPVGKEVVDSLAKILEDAKVYKLNGYRLEEPICGGHSNRIYMEYSSGDKVNAFWYGHGVKDEAIRAYNLIAHFFKPWCEQAVREARLQQLTDRITRMEGLYDKVSAAVSKRKAYPGLREDVDSLSIYMDSGTWKEDFEADERGELPAGLKRGVLSQDGLYNLLESDRLYKLLTRK